MKKFLLTPILILYSFFSFSQDITSPTLSAGIESLTLNKGTIDVEVLSEIILEKQRELKGEALKRFMLKLFPDDNYTTKFYIQNCLHVLLNEKNPQVIKREILELTTNYALGLGFTYALIKMKTDSTDPVIVKLKEFENKYRDYKNRSKDSMRYFAHYKNALKKRRTLLRKTKNISRKKEDLRKINTKQAVNRKSIRKNNRKNRRIKVLLDRIEHIKLRYDLVKYNDIITSRNILYAHAYNGKLKNNSDKKKYTKIITSLKKQNLDSFLKNNYCLTNSDSTKIIEKYIKSYDTLKIKHDRLPFNILFDVVSTVLSDIHALKDKGFFQQKINYKLNPYYNDFKNDTDLVKSIDSFEKKLELKVTTYIENYDLVSELLKNSNRKKIDTIVSNLIKQLNKDKSPLFQKNYTDLNDKIKDYFPTNNNKIRKNEIISLLDTLKKHSINKVKYNLDALLLNNQILSQYDTVFKKKLAEFLPLLYQKIKDIDQGKEVSANNRYFLEDEVYKTIIQLRIYSNDSLRNLDSLALFSKHISIIEKIRKLILFYEKVGNYSDQMYHLFEFISNLNKLDKAETFTSLASMMREGSHQLVQELPENTFRENYLVFTKAMRKYTIINTNENKIDLDVPSFLVDLQNYYDRKNTSNWSLYLSVGLNQNIFLKENFTFPDNNLDTINSIGFASEKLGIKYKFLNFNKINGYQNVIREDIYLSKRAPFINNFYGIIYGSGLLYSLANSSTNKNFNFPHIGIGVGIRFYNALDFNTIIGFPFVKNRNFGSDAFIGIGFDIPLGQYIEKLGKKR